MDIDLNCHLTTCLYMYRSLQLSRLFGEASFCTRWWLIQRSMTSHNKRLWSAQLEMRHLHHTLHIPGGGKIFRAGGSGWLQGAVFVGQACHACCTHDYPWFMTACPRPGQVQGRNNSSKVEGGAHDAPQLMAAGWWRVTFLQMHPW